MTNPDWGHGPNQPVRVFTEEQIREVMKKHHYSSPDQGERGGLCSCKYTTARAVDYTVDHFIEKLKEERG